MSKLFTPVKAEKRREKKRNKKNLHLIWVKNTSVHFSKHCPHHTYIILVVKVIFRLYRAL